MTPIFLPQEAAEARQAVDLVETSEAVDAVDPAEPDEVDAPEVDPVYPVDSVHASDRGDVDEELPGAEGLDLEIDLGLPDEPAKAARTPQAPLLDLQSAIEKVPAALRSEMEAVLRAEFREVIRWKAPK